MAPSEDDGFSLRCFANVMPLGGERAISQDLLPENSVRTHSERGKW